jgi:hypothetical protein
MQFIKQEQIQNNQTYKKVLKDSFGGVMYNIANRDKYNSKVILSIWGTMTDGEKSATGGIMNGAMHFLQGN